MKTKQLLLQIAILAIVLVFSACSDSQKNDDLTFSDNTEEESLKNSAVLSVPTLTDVDSMGIIFMREEEKLARDAYLSLYAKYEHQIFDNISQSEQVHTDAILSC